MSALVLVVGALLLAAGGYEMYAGSVDILSERGWSAFIAGAVLVAGGTVTMATGVAVRAVDRLRGALMQGGSVKGASLGVPSRSQTAERIEPGETALAPAVIAPPSPQHDLFSEPAAELAPLSTMLAAPIELASAHEPQSIIEPPAPPHGEGIEAHEPPSPAPVDAQHDDWLEHSFAELERETRRHEPALASLASVPEPPSVAAEPHVPASTVHDGSAARAPHDDYAYDAHPSEAHAYDAGEESHPEDQEPPGDQAIVSAREEPIPATSAVIGRYESEGTSYVMYADGSIDAQSEAGVYRFASMAELKAFIES